MADKYHGLLFRSSVGVDDAFAVSENVCSKSMEWSVPMWCARLATLPKGHFPTNFVVRENFA